MKLVLYSSVFWVMLSSVASADSVLLTCETKGGDSAGKVVIDLRKETLIHGVFEYKIISLTEELLLAESLKSESMLTGSWVIRRATGQFWAVSVLRNCWSDGCDNDSLHEFSMSGFCRGSVF